MLRSLINKQQLFYFKGILIILNYLNILGPWNPPFQMCEVISSVSVSCDQTLKTMKECWDENQYLLCPHTAVGASVIWDQR